jgi:PPOX class probable F420-dependent enzyme
MSALKQFENQQFINIETFRKNGQGVKTPVWFAREGDLLYVWTGASSGKIKRIRLNPDVKIAPAKADGTPLGEWAPAKASSDDSPEALRHIVKLMRKKYGFSFTIFQLMGMIRRDKHTSLRIQVTG